MGLRAKTAPATNASGVVAGSANGKMLNGQRSGAAVKLKKPNIGSTAKPATVQATPKLNAQRPTVKQLSPASSSSSSSSTAAVVKSSQTPAPASSETAKAAPATTTTCVRTVKSTTFRSCSTSALMAANGSSCMLRPQTLNVHHFSQTPADQTQSFFGEVLSAWRAKARCNVVPADRTQELFHELSFHPSDKQISDMLQMAKLLARKGSRQPDGLTFGEFCVLAADLKRFRTSTFSPTICDRVTLLNSLHSDTEHDTSTTTTAATTAAKATTNNINNSQKRAENCSFPNAGTELRSTKSLSNVEDCKKKLQTRGSASDASSPVEVFLGGSCNPTTWRADVAIPALKELGISFYNPQVSDWTPDLIELEHRAKEKARVLFFVMDSETRASAGAIEAAHIAGQNCKQLVLVLHPYKPNQYILNEHISQQEYIDLMRNQLILKELVTRRGLPVLDNIPSGLQRTKEVLAGIRDPPSNIASILVVVRGAFDRVSPVNELITGAQCQRALLYLGYAQNLLNLDNLNKIIATQRDTLAAMLKHSTSHCAQGEEEEGASSTASPTASATAECDDCIDFDLFCVISAHLSVLQQEIHESGCISPIKGINVPPPPVYLTNMQGEESFAIRYYANKNISRTSSNASVPSSNGSSSSGTGSGIGSSIDEHRQSLNDLLSRSRDSGTSSPLPLQMPYEPSSFKSKSAAHLSELKPPVLVNVESVEMTSEITTTQTTVTGAPGAAAAQQTPPPAQPPLGSSSSTITTTTTTTTTVQMDPSGGVGGGGAEEESDSNDSVFSSSSSINSMKNCCVDPMAFASVDYRDVYLGGSCFLRTKWRQAVAMPYLSAHGVSYHLPALHESIQPSQLDLPEKMFAKGRTIGAKERTLMRTRRKWKDVRAANNGALANEDDDDDDDEDDDEEEEVTISEELSFSWALSPVRSNLYNPSLLDSSRVLLFVITNETRSLAPMTLAAHCIGLMYNVVLAVQMLPDDCVISNEKLTPAAIKDYNRGRSYLIDLAKRQGVPVFNDLLPALACTVEKIKACQSRQRYD